MSTITNKISDRRFLKKNMTKQWILSNGFHYNRIFSNEEYEVYTYRFPVLKYERFVVLECELRVMLGEDNVIIDVYDYNTINRYAPFYYQEYGNYNKMLEEIWDKINKVTNKLGIKEKRINNGSENKEIKRKCNNSNKRKQRGSGV